MSTFIDGSSMNRSGYNEILRPGGARNIDIYVGNIFPGDNPPVDFSFILVVQPVSYDENPAAVYICTHNTSTTGDVLRCTPVNNPGWSFSRTSYAQNHVLLEGLPLYESNRYWYVSCIPLIFE